MTTSHRPISVFDVDRTLTKQPTYSLFLLLAARQLAPWRIALVPMLIPRLLAYQAKWSSRRSLKEAMHAVLLGSRLSRVRAERVAEAFARRLADCGMYQQGRALIAAEASAGRRIVLASAAPRLYVAPFARRLGIDDVVATESWWIDDQLSHRIDGENCYGAAKLAMLEQFLTKAGIARGAASIRFYSDHASDLPTFEWADEPIAVNPSPQLLAIARMRGWQILDWRR